MAFCDFVVRVNPEKDTQTSIAEKILYSIYILRLKGKKPAVTFVGGESGEGKSLSVLTIMYTLLKIQGIDPFKVVNDVNVYVPIEYPQKLNKLLFPEKEEKDKEKAKILKKTNCICIHEAREVVKAKLWHSFLNQAVSDINAMSRSIKRLAIFIVSQFIRDISSDIRYTLNYYVTVKRPRGKPARLYINVMWKDDRDLEKPKLRKRKLSGYLVYPDGKYQHYIPQYLELSRPPKEIEDIFEQADYEAKARIIKGKINKLIKEMQIDMEQGTKRLEVMVDYYTKNQERLLMVGKRYRGKWKVNTQFREMHDLSKQEANLFSDMINEKLKDKGVIKNE
jgi:hypothetical protein